VVLQCESAGVNWQIQKKMNLIFYTVKMRAVRTLLGLNAIDIKLVTGDTTNIDEDCCKYDYVNAIIICNMSWYDMLMHSCIYGAIRILRNLVTHGVDIRINSDYAVRYASKYGHLEIVKYLVSHGADIHTDNDYAVRYASEFGHLEVVQYLVSLGADIHACIDDAVRWASRRGHLEVVRYLVSQGADIHADNDYAIRYASKNGHTEVAQYIETLM
jgi:hypothetical protein